MGTITTNYEVSQCMCGNGHPFQQRGLSLRLLSILHWSMGFFGDFFENQYFHCAIPESMNGIIEFVQIQNVYENKQFYSTLSDKRLLCLGFASNGKMVLVNIDQYPIMHLMTSRELCLKNLTHPSI